MNKKVLTTCFAACGLIVGLSLIPVSGIMAQNVGRPEMTLNGGSKGPVLFKHQLHQTVVNDCAVCHKDFEKKPGALDAAKKTGVLRAKQVMNKTCIACHRAKRKAGEKSGPTSCSACHS
ncbi:cytochrome c3 family protein [uncultured Desulfobacter sp.]|uniref:cytochrome c3 family protein n=1 Tax=uncultured Desulfobacter sp. TaxID=240139 RepID=UPI002AA7DF44|nr:cytochrome c3 family protein [uncultured Desulfobacter sp.]